MDSAAWSIPCLRGQCVDVLHTLDVFPARATRRFFVIATDPDGGGRADGKVGAEPVVPGVWASVECVPRYSSEVLSIAYVCVDVIEATSCRTGREESAAPIALVLFYQSWLRIYEVF